MKLVVGLGNPGSEYTKTRHNVGFMALDFLQKAFSASVFCEDKKSSSLMANSLIDQEKILLVKPNTFMNESGKAVRALVDFYKLAPNDIVVIHDDLDIAPATMRTTESSRAAGHNGVQDIIEKLGTQDFFRIRIGIGRPTEVNGACMPSHDFVLQNFSEEELDNLTELFPKIKEEVFAFLKR